MPRRMLRKTSDTKKRVPNGCFLLLATASISLILYFNVVHAADTGFSSTYAYYTVGKRFEISDAVAALDAAIATDKPILIYVHGRGKEPKKSLSTKKIVPLILEDAYGVTALMVNWDSYGFLFDRKRPLTNVPEGAERLGALILAMQEKRVKGTLPTNISLIAHSMGNIVLEDAVMAGVWEGVTAPLFANVVMTSPDADAQGHQVWLARLASKEVVWVTINENDGTLSKAGSGRTGTTPLGLGPKPKDQTARAATYLDLTGIVKDKHQVFNKATMFANIAICNLFQSVLRSEKTDAIALGWSRTSSGKLIPATVANRNDRCFNDIVDSDADDRGD